MGMGHDTSTVEQFGEAANPEPAALDLDAGAYMDDLGDLDITEAQKRELLETLWSIMRSFVEMGFDVDICAALTDGGTDANSAEIE